MMNPSIPFLISVADTYLAISDARQESTVSHRVFGDTKKLASLRAGGEITVGRYNAAFRWFAANWPDGHPLPPSLLPYSPQTKEDAA